VKWARVFFAKLFNEWFFAHLNRRFLKLFRVESS
jgi:hypothetical protein